MLNKKEPTLMEFPCTFPMKIMGDKEFDLEKFVRQNLEKHVKDHSSIAIKTRESSGGKYISVTATFEAQNQKQLDKLYKIFSKHKHVKFVL